MTGKVTNGFWIFESSLVSTLLILAHLVKYDFSDNDFDAIKYGLVDTSNEKDIWWTYKFTGEQIIDLRFARDQDNPDMIFIQSTFDKTLSAQVEIAIFVVQNFDIKHKHYYRND